MSNVELLAAKLPNGAQREHDGHEDRGRHEDDLAEDAHGDEPTTRIRMLETKKLAKMPLTVAPCS